MQTTPASVNEFMERLVHKKDDVKHRLNDIVDELFAYLAIEVGRLVQPSPVMCCSKAIQTETIEIETIDQIDQCIEVDEPIDDVLNSKDEPKGDNPTPAIDLSIVASTSNAFHAIIDDELDDESDHEHSESDCDCEPCMGVSICKVNRIGHEHEQNDDSDRSNHSKKIKLTNGGTNGGHCSSTSETIGYYNEEHGEQCSATFRTISIKCSQDECPSMFKNKIERNQHLIYVHGILPYKCLRTGCKQSFDNVRQYGEHIATEHKDVTSWQCNQCAKVCADHRLLCRHVYFYHQEGRFKCRKSKCNFVAPFRIEVRKHSQMHTEMYACQFGCGKSFSHTHHRKRHERIHLRLKPFRCKWPNCGYCSEARSTVIRHIRIRHFNLPLTLKQQNELNIVDNRNPRDYMEILTELMN